MVTTALRLIASLRAYDIAEYRSNVAVLTRCAATIANKGGAATAVRIATMPTATIISDMVNPRWRRCALRVTSPLIRFAGTMTRTGTRMGKHRSNIATTAAL